MNTEDLRDEFPRRRYIRCSDGFCGADDCPTCRPWNFIDGVFIEDTKEEE